MNKKMVQKGRAEEPKHNKYAVGGIRNPLLKNLRSNDAGDCEHRQKNQERKCTKPILASYSDATAYRGNRACSHFIAKIELIPKSNNPKLANYTKSPSLALPHPTS